MYDVKSYKNQGFLYTSSFHHYDRVFVKVEKIIFYLIASFIAFKYVNLWCVSLHLHSSLRPCKWWPRPQSEGFRKHIKLLKKFLKCDEILSVSIESIWLLLSCVSLVLELGQTFQLFCLTFSSSISDATSAMKEEDGKHPMVRELQAAVAMGVHKGQSKICTFCKNRL